MRYATPPQIERGDAVYGPVRCAQLPNPDKKQVKLAVVNDTHENEKIIGPLVSRISVLAADLLVWNGDNSNNFYDDARLGELCLVPGADPDDPAAGGWASTRPLLFVPGNHDIRGPRARILPKALTPWPSGVNDPPGLSNTGWSNGRYCFALRHGPLAIIGSDTGEDKPDRRPIFAGLAAFEPYRRAQRDWLAQALARPEIASAPHLVAFCHIPRNGMPGQNDGQTDEDYARYCGHGRAL